VFDPQLRQEVTTAIHRFADDYPDAQIVVSSRLIGFQHERWRQEGFRPFMLQELDKEQRDLFLQRWHQLAYDDERKGERKRDSLLKAIQQSPAIQQLAGNPLLLTLMAILNRSQELPRDRAELYSQCARLLLHQWKTELAFEATPELAQAQLDVKDKLGLMKRIAWTLQAGADGAAGNLTNLIEENQLERTLSEGLEGIPGLRPDRAARALIEQLRGRNFMLCFMGGGNYAFVHRTFLEFFCAEAIVDRFQVEQELTLDALKTEIFGHWPDETWHEVLRLVAGRLAPKFVKEILDWLLLQPDPNQTCNHIFFAARCVGEVRNRGELGSTEGRVRQDTKDLLIGIRKQFSINIRYVVEVPDLRGSISVTNDLLKSSPLRHITISFSEEGFQIDFTEQKAVAVIADVWKDSKDTLPWIKDLMQYDESELVRRSALQELARGWKEEPGTLSSIKECTQSDDAWLMRQSAVLELTRGWKDEPDTLAIVKERAQSDENWAVRKSAVEELAHGWKDDPDTLVILKERTQSDENENVRKSAVRELARGWKNDPDMLVWLKERAQSDENWAVRQSAVEELARGWKDEPATLAIVKERAQSDENWAVRQSAVLELARGWKDEPDTLAILKERAQSDENEDVRQSAVEELARGWKNEPEIQAFLKGL
jgi:predicted NACHT family NTPase